MPFLISWWWNRQQWDYQAGHPADAKV
uniref:Uncharacterized protein n=1 Tax=Anguilla anguilla TaxID=7936 RepID=A0A0E9QHM4_ANGAN